MLDSSSQLLSYDTTFQLDDFYVSPLIVQHTLFREKPCIPAMFLIHERKLTVTQQVMFKECIKRIPSLKKAKCTLVADREKAIMNANTNEIPSLKLVHSWNRICRDIQAWCPKHGVPSADITVYCEDVFQLFHSPNEEEYNTRLEGGRKVWDAAFEAYYMREIHPDVPQSTGRWVLERHHVYTSYCGVTNNQSEGLNRFVLHCMISVSLQSLHTLPLSLSLSLSLFPLPSLSLVCVYGCIVNITYMQKIPLILIRMFCRVLKELLE